MTAPPASPASWIRRAARSPITAAFFIAIVFSFLPAAGDIHYPLAEDSPSYMQPGASIWRGEGFGQKYVRWAWRRVRDYDFDPELMRTPGYPFVIGPFLGAEVARGGEAAPDRLLPVLLLQAIMRGGIVALLLTLPTGEFRGPRAAWLGALDILGAILSGYILTETMAALLLTLSVAAALHWRARKDWRWLALAGAAAGIGILTRPINIAAGFALSGMMLVALWRERGGSLRFLGQAMLLLLAVWSAPLGWMMRNAAYTGHHVLSLIGSVNLLHYRAADIIAREESRRTGKPYDFEVGRRYADMWEEGWDGPGDDTLGRRAPESPAEVAQLGEERTAKAMEIIRAHPVFLIQGAMAGLGRELAGPGREFVNRWVRAFAADSPGVSRVIGMGMLAAIMLHLALVYGLVAAGLWRAGKARSPTMGLLLPLGVAGALLVLGAGPEAYSRFRVPVMPLLMIAASWRPVKHGDDT